MMTVKLQKPHRQNGVTHHKGEVLRIPYKLGRAMCDQGWALQYPEGTAEFKAKQRMANAAKVEKQAEAQSKTKTKK